jgi:hypothetical protein
VDRAVTIGYVLLGIGGFVTIWSIWELRNYSPERMGVFDRIALVLQDVVRIAPRLKTKLNIRIERTSHWLGLLIGPVILSLGLILVLSE